MNAILKLYGISSEAQVFSGSLAELDSVGKEDTKEIMEVENGYCNDVYNMLGRWKKGDRVMQSE